MPAAARDRLPPDGALPGGLAIEPKADGFRVIVFVRAGSVVLQSRGGANLAPGFPEIVEAAAAIGEDVVLDGELTVAYQERLDFTELQRRARRTGRGAAQAALTRPAHVIVFDVLEADGVELLDRRYRARRARLEDLFARRDLAAPWTLCPATTDRATAQGWLDPAWGVARIEEVVCKGLAQPYVPGKRGWIKVRTRQTSEAVIGGVTGSLRAPQTLLLGRYTRSEDLRLIDRTTALSAAARHELGQELSPADAGHPWQGRRFSAGWGTRKDLDYERVRPDLVAEFLADTAFEDARYRHPVRYLRLRGDLTTGVLPVLDT